MAQRILIIEDEPGLVLTLTDLLASEGYEVASAKSDASFAVVRFIPQASLGDITNFLGAHKAAVVDGPKPGGLYRIRLSQAPLPRDEVSRIVKRMQDESKIVGFIAAAD